MVTTIDAIAEKLTDIKIKRYEADKSTKLEKAEFEFWKNFVDKHPKFCKFVHDHRKAIDITCDVVMTVCIAKIAYNIGQINLAKDLENWKVLGVAAYPDDKSLQIQSLVTLPKSQVTGTVVVSTDDTVEMMQIANQVIEALHNNGVEFTTL